MAMTMRRASAGIGGSRDRPEDAFTLDSWCEDILQLAEHAFGAGVRFALFGCSMGYACAAGRRLHHPTLPLCEISGRQPNISGRVAW